MPAETYRPRLRIEAILYTGIASSGAECEAFLGDKFQGFAESTDQICVQSRWGWTATDPGVFLARFPDGEVETLGYGQFLALDGGYEIVPDAAAA